MANQRIVLKMEMSQSEKTRKKAMKLAAAATGVRSVSIQGQNDQLVLIGQGIDLSELIRELKKKVCETSIITVQAAPPPQPQYNEMPPTRRCMCEIPNSGFCGYCRSMRQNQYHMVAQPCPPAIIYEHYHGEPDRCRIM